MDSGVTSGSSVQELVVQVVQAVHQGLCGNIRKFQEIQELAVKRFIRSKWIKRAGTSGSSGNTGVSRFKGHQEIQELVVKRFIRK
jgi:hypothetical protein